jgi:hypothetical protein
MGATSGAGTFSLPEHLGSPPILVGFVNYTFLNIFIYQLEEEFEDTKGVIRIRKLKKNR